MVAKKNEPQSILDESEDLFDPNLDPDRFEGLHFIS